MWLFHKKNKNIINDQKSDERTASEQDIGEICLKIAEIISKNDTSVISELKEGFANPLAYVAKYHKHLSELFMLDEFEMEGYVRDKWWLMTDVLELYDYVCKRDWKDELEDFLFFLSDTKRAKLEQTRLYELGLPFSENDDIPKWSSLIDNELTNRNLTVGNIDTESDEYTLFLCTTDELELLQKYAQSINHKIAPAKME